MNNGQQLLSEIVVYDKYSKYIPELGRRETWNEIVERYIGMMKSKYPSLVNEIEDNKRYLLNKEVLPSMRALQFGGKAIEKNEARAYNCAYLPVDHHYAFSEILFLLLGGTGVGYSVQQHHIDKLPEIKKPTKLRKFVIDDSIMGWADSVKALMKAYFGYSKSKPVFSFGEIRAKGARLVTAGGKAPGPEPLKKCLFNIELILERKKNGEKLTSLEVHDIVCHIADSVLAGGIRRAALISLFSADDTEMRSCKHGAWWEQNAQRGRANNSAVILRHKVEKSFFDALWQDIKDSNAGEPGIYFTNDKDWGTNPCVEISLRPFTFCNLCEINVSDIINPNDLLVRAKVAAFFGTLQAGFTDFHYLRDIWRSNTEKDALIGVGMTGIASNTVNDKKLLNQASDVVKKENERVANLIGINKAARTTTIKPSGTTSCVLACSSGIHAWYDSYYIRSIQTSVGSDLYNYFAKNRPELIKIMDWDINSAVIGLPQKAPNNAILRNEEDVLTFLERIKLFNEEWVRKGYRSGQNHNNVSATVYIKDDEWDAVGEWMWNNKNSYNGLSVLPYDGGTYKDAPFQTCDEVRYNELMDYIDKNPVVITDIIEDDDYTDQSAEAACAGGACEIVFNK